MAVSHLLSKYFCILIFLYKTKQLFSHEDGYENTNIVRQLVTMFFLNQTQTLITPPLAETLLSGGVIALYAY